MKHLRMGMAALIACLMIAAAGAQERRGERPGPRVQERGGSALEPTLRDVVYGQASGRDLLLDVYRAESDEPTPAVIFIHGGGWRGGSKNRIHLALGEQALTRGISIVSVGYRFTNEAPHPAQVEDCLRAVQFVRHMAEEWNIDPERLAAMGTSAGAHLALMVGLRDDAADPESDDPALRESSRVSCVVNYFGPTDFHLIKTMQHNHPAYRQLLGIDHDPEAQPTDERLDDVSPAHFVSPDDPPVLTCHGTDDNVVPYAHAERLHARLEAAGVESTLITVEGAGHSFRDHPQPDEETTRFLKKHLLGDITGLPAKSP